jgi:hypothetical protein
LACRGPAAHPTTCLSRVETHQRVRKGLKWAKEAKIGKKRRAPRLLVKDWKQWKVKRAELANRALPYKLVHFMYN